MTDLIKRLEEAQEGSRELDLAIEIHLRPTGDVANAVATHWRGPFDGREGHYWDWWGASQNFCVERRTADGRCPFNGSYPLPHYSTSLDAAMTLVPEGYMVDQIGEWEALPLRAKGPWYAIVRLRAPTTEFSKARADHRPTPALALCIASLKSREIKE